MIEIGAFSISLAHTGSMPQRTAAKGNTPIPSNRLPSRSAVILSAPLSLDGQNALKGGGGDAKPLGNGDVVLHSLSDGIFVTLRSVKQSTGSLPLKSGLNSTMKITFLLKWILMGLWTHGQKTLLNGWRYRRKGCISNGKVGPV